MNKLKMKYRTFVLLLVGMVMNACIEPFELENNVIESALVVEATITDETKQHVVKLSRAYELESELEKLESNAQVKVVEDGAAEYLFQETEPGTYKAIQAFAANAGSNYVLLITTADGSMYTSDSETTPEKVPITKLYVERGVNDLGEEGVSILLDNESPAGEPKYFRYQFEETYKIVAPNWSPFEYDIINDDLYNPEFYQAGLGGYFIVGLKEEEEPRRICYNTIRSSDIKQVSTASLSENTISKFPVRFLNRENYIISHRYSNLVTQYTQTPEAFFYFQKLNDFASSESVFTDIQAGFLEGNVKSINNKDEKVIGYFEVAAVDRKRLYFNYADLFPDESLPKYPITCDLDLDITLYHEAFHAGFNGRNGEWVCDTACYSPLINAIKEGSIAYSQTKPGYEGVNMADLAYVAPFLSKARGCVDCRALGSNVKPDFWEDE
ncbi:MAG: DUF4249 domain-containing protein [Flavobacteriaceae bacterium]